MFEQMCVSEDVKALNPGVFGRQADRKSHAQENRQNKVHAIHSRPPLSIHTDITDDCLKPMTEEQFSRTIEDLLTAYQWRWCHFRPARTDKGYRTALSGDKGSPDYWAVRDGRFLAIELKSQKGYTTQDQIYWQYDLLKCKGVEYYCWRPKDWDRIAGVLR